MQPLRATFDRSSIRFRLFRLVVMIATAVLAISLAGGALFEWNHQQAQVTKSLSIVAQATGTAASAAVAFRDRRAAGEALNLLIAQKEIEAAAIYPVEGYRLASYGDKGLLPEEGGQLREHLPNFSLFSPSTTLFQPIMLDDATIGHIFISASLLESRNDFLLKAALAIGVNLLGLFLALGLGLRLLDSILEPVRELANTSRHVRQSKNFSLRVTTPAAGVPHDEIGELVVSFNAMLAEIEQREHDLMRYHNELEHMVLERTEALHAANRELSLARDAAEAASVSKSRFLAAASHDLRQPIQAINLFRDALNRTELTTEQQRISDYISRSALSLGELLDALLDISKLDSGAVTPTPEVIAIHELFNSLDAEFAPVALASSLRFKLHFPFGEMTLFTDGKLLQCLLRNLVGNALKYNTEGGGVLVGIRRRSDQAIIQVWDTGIGIASEYMDTIFDEYFQVANPERDNAKGLGLGLSIVKRIAKLLETDVVCRSRPGRGSVFEFRLPLADKPIESQNSAH